MTTTSDDLSDWWLQAAIDADKAIHAEGYYLDIWAKVRPTLPWSELTKKEALKPFQRFWEELPDSPAIHRHPFNSICNLAEEFVEMDTTGEELARTAAIALAGYEPDPDFPGTYRRKKA